jgi:hypothetical protein
MNAVRRYATSSLLGVGLLVLAITTTVSSASVQSVQAAPKRTRTPTPTWTPIYTPTPTPVPYGSPTPGPTTSVDGTWKIASSPNIGTGTYGNQLDAVAVVSASDVWAVGFSPHPSGTPLYIRRTLVEHWDGKTWSVIPSPNPAGATYVVLNGVAAISANDIWAVGHSGDPSSIPHQTLTEHWDGTGWSIIPSPSPGTYNGNVLYAVAAVSTNDVWAVGWAESGPTGQEGGALTMHWDGASWTVISNPSRAALLAVTAIAPNDVWAVGYQVILHWDGATWSSVAFPPPPGNSYQVFKDISAVSANDIWAVGYSQASYFYGYIYSTLTYHWDGTQWNWVPNAGGSDYLYAVDAIAANDVWAVGDNGYTQHWNGATWSQVAGPYPGLGGRFNGVAAASTSDVWAVGYFTDGNYSDGYQNKTWIGRYTVP